MKLLNLFLNALYPEGVACLLCNRNARLDRRGLCEKCRESIDPAAEIHIDGVISGAVAAMAYNDAAVPVPLHPKREKERGYNQSMILAEELGRRYDIPVRPRLLKRIRYTEMQSMTAGRDRRENVRGAFRARECKGGNILLVDDVITTGSTMEECAIALKNAGAGKIYCAAAAYAGHGEGE